MQYDLNKKLLKIIPFYDSFIDVPEIKKLSNVQLVVIQEVIKLKLLIKSSKISINDLFKDLLVELKDFKYRLILNILLSKQKISDLTEFRSVYFNSLTKTVIGDNYF